MAYDYNYDEVDQGQSSKFNAGLLQMKRLHEVQDLLNRASLNPLAYNEEIGVYNFQIMFSSITTLLNESSAKLGATERKEAEALREGIRSFLTEKPIFEMTQDVKVGGSKSVIRFNKKNWNILEKYLIQYQTLVRKQLDAHNLNSPNQEDDQGL